MKDIRWQQRLKNFDKALIELSNAIDITSTRELSRLEKQGLIQAFEYNYELAWNCIKDFYKSQGETEIQGSRDAFRMAFNRDLITEGNLWMEMIQSRIKTSHTYNQETAEHIAQQIVELYYPEIKKLNIKLNDLKNKK
mgnify:CR=1 FL=1